jgi:hypothetical protein
MPFSFAVAISAFHGEIVAVTELEEPLTEAGNIYLRWNLDTVCLQLLQRR